MLHENTRESRCHSTASVGEDSRRNRFDCLHRYVFIDMTLSRCALVRDQSIACITFACANVAERWNGEKREMDSRKDGQRSKWTLHDRVSSTRWRFSCWHRSLLGKSVKFCIRFVANKNPWMIYVKGSIWIRNSCFSPGTETFRSVGNEGIFAFR